MARKCAQSKEELQKARRQWEATGINRKARRKARKAGVSPVVEAKNDEKQEESQKQA